MSSMQFGDVSARRAPHRDAPGRSPVAARAPRSAPNPLWHRVATSTGPLQAKLAVSAPGDACEQEADRVAAQVVGTPDSASVGVAHGTSPLAISRMCASCAAEEEVSTESRIASLRSSGGTALSPPLRSYFEPRLGHDFSNVRLHHGPEAARAAREVHAHAFTVGRDIVFASGAPRPDTRDGRQLLAHELVHTVQQGAAGSRGTLESPGESPAESPAAPIAARMPLGTVAGKWVIKNADRRYPNENESQTDGEILGEAFRKICDGTSLIDGGKAIGVRAGTQKAGCACLADIEKAQAGTYKRPGKTNAIDLHGTPQIRLEPHGWSATERRVNNDGEIKPPDVTIRHPFGTFDYGYWKSAQGTPAKESQHLDKDFFLTVAHEVCGHVAGWVRTGDEAVRGSTTGHDLAIKGENEIATEHGVKSDDLRGLDTTPGSVHHGESFLRGSIPFSDASDALPREETREVLDEAVDSIQGVARQRIQLFVQVEGLAVAAEGGGKGMAEARAKKVHDAIESRLKSEGINMSLPDPDNGGKATPRIFPDIQTVLDDSAGRKGRRADVFLFHNSRSAR